MEGLKGHINVLLEIDYETLLKDKNIEALSLFTGKTEPKEIAKEHISMLAKELENVVKDRPLVDYQINGYFDNGEQEQEQEQEQEDDCKEFEGEGESNLNNDNNIEYVEAEMIDDGNNIDYISLIDEDITDISSNKGIPKHIIAEPVVLEQFIKKYGIEHGQTVDTYRGIKVDVGEVENGVYEIHYKSYEQVREGVSEEYETYESFVRTI